MKDYEIRIAIAQCCGWTNCEYVELLRDVKGIPPQGWKGDYILCRNEAWVPNYTSDLNAMHEAEKTLIEPEKTKFLNALFDASAFDNEWNQVHATASQRAEAYLRTKELWKD